MISGFKDWNDATRRFKIHQESEMHMEAVLKLTSQQVDVALNKKHLSQKQTNREMLKEVVRGIIYLCRQSIALRGQ